MCVKLSHSKAELAEALKIFMLRFFWFKKHFVLIRVIKEVFISELNKIIIIKISISVYFFKIS